STPCGSRSPESRACTDPPPTLPCAAEEASWPSAPESPSQRRCYPLTAQRQLFHLGRAQFRERLDMPARQHERVARIRGMDVEKGHDQVAVEDRARRKLAGENPTEDTGMHRYSRGPGG